MIWLMVAVVIGAAALVTSALFWREGLKIREFNRDYEMQIVSQRRQLEEDIHEFKNSKHRVRNGKKLRTKSNRDGHNAAKAALAGIDPDLIAALTARDAA